jgi:hypothetical protein
MKVISTKIKRYDMIGTIYNGIKIVDYVVHYPKSKTLCIVYNDESYFWCTDTEMVEVMRPRKAKTLYFSETEIANIDKPKFYDIENLLKKVKL